MSETKHTPESERVKKQDEAFEAAIPTDEDSLLQALSLFVEQKHSLHVPARPTDADLVLRKGIKELTEARAKITTLTRERDEARDHRDLVTGQILMVGSEIGGDPKLDPRDYRDPRWTPTLEEAAKLRAEVERLRGALEALSTAERHYRDMYQRHGGQALDTGRAWEVSHG